jgi:hypothetical protein
MTSLTLHSTLGKTLQLCLLIFSGNLRLREVQFWMSKLELPQSLWDASGDRQVKIGARSDKSALPPAF